MAGSSPRIFNIPASAPFLRTLIRALLDGKLVPGFPAGDDPLELARATLYLPTQRARRLAREVFLDCMDNRSAILPRIVAIGDIDEDEIIFAQAAAGELADAALTLPAALSPLERRLLLAQLVSKWAASPELHGAEGTPLVANTPSAALSLADDLARLIDDMITREVDWKALDTLVKDNRSDLDEYWQKSLKLLNVVREQWPKILAVHRVIEAAARRDRLIEAETARLRGGDAPVIAAGSTGSMPATAKLIATIASLSHGAVVLPGLDMDLDDKTWRSLAGDGKAELHDGGMPAFGHAQFAMQALLSRIGISRSAIAQLAPAQGREAFISEALRPAATTEHWPERRAETDFAAQTERALAGITMIEADNAEEEALAIAVALREAADDPAMTAALITPDRSLARRVLAALERWRVPVDDSGGDSLADTPAGLFARLTAEAALGGLEPVTLLALLKHPLLRLGAAEGAHARAVAALERAVLRGPRPKPLVAGLAHALTTYRAERDGLHPRDPRTLVSAADLDAAAALVGILARALAPLEKLTQANISLVTFAARHREVLAALAGDAAFAGADGKKLETAFEELIDSEAAQGVVLAAGDYPELFETTIAGRTVRMREQPGVRIRIFGPLEARLQSIDRVVLGGLNEGTWPPETRSDPWLSRPMRLALGLDLPERRVGLAAHDFAQALGAREVIISRAAKMAGAPTVPARFVQRIAALAGESWNAALERGATYLALARALDAPQAAPQQVARPEPKPPLAARPIRLSVTEIEHWLRDPYTIYAKHILKLVPLEAVDTPPGAADRGSVIHEAIGKFTQQFAEQIPVDAEARLIALGEDAFAYLEAFPEAKAFWWPRFRRIAHWLVGWETARRPRLAKLYGEISGTLEIPLGARVFTLSARADRIERASDGSYAVLDYKTGAPPTEPQVRTGLAPQMTLEAAILRGGGFKDVAPGNVAAMIYVRLRGSDPPGETKLVDFKDGTPDSHADHALARLTDLVRKFEDATTPYASLVHPMWTTHYGDYDHLARVKEWAASGGEDAEGEP